MGEGLRLRGGRDAPAACDAAAARQVAEAMEARAAVRVGGGGGPAPNYAPNYAPPGMARKPS